MSTLRDRTSAPRRQARQLLALIAVTRLRAMLAEWHRRARSRAVLAGLAEHELRDIGVTSAERRCECAKPFWRG